MLIINADDYGRGRLATDRIIECFRKGSLTSASAMVFMEDSERAASLAPASGLETGLHVNFTEKFNAKGVEALLVDYHSRIAKFLTRHRFASIFYHPTLRQQFAYVFHTQLAEYDRLYNSAPSHFDGHHHMHLCANMLIGGLIAKGHKVRRNFSFRRGEKSGINRFYRSLVDRHITRKYRSTDYLFSLPSCHKNGGLDSVVQLARTSNVELEAHPENPGDFEILAGDSFLRLISSVQTGGYALL